MKKTITLLAISLALHTQAQTGKLFLLAGQSNAVGQGTSTLSATCTAGTAYEYDAATNSVKHLADPMGQKLNNLEPAGSGSVGPSFAKTLNALTGKTIYMISAARGGSSNGVKGELSPYGTWDDTGSLMIFGNAVDKVNKAIQKTGLPLSGIIWMQGERDANSIRTGNQTEAEYKAALERVISRFRKEFGPRLPFYIVLTGLQGTIADGPLTTEANYAVRRIQAEVARNTPNVYVAYYSTNTFFTKGWMKNEATTVHYTQPALNEIGDSVARKVATITYDTIANIPPPIEPIATNTQIIVDNTDAGCTFDTPWATSTFTPGFYGTNYTQDGSAAANPGKWAKWTPNLTNAGQYRLFMRYAGGAGRPTQAPVEINHANGIKNTTIDQTINGGIWNYLGQYSFNAGTSGYVKLYADAVGSTIADAVMFEKQQTTDASEIKSTSNLLKLSQLAHGDIQFVLNANSNSIVSLSLYSVYGNEVNRLINNHLSTGSILTGTLSKSTLPKGVYLAKLVVNGQTTACAKFILK